MSPPPCRFRHVDVLPPPGMKSITAPTVQAAGHPTPAPVAGFTQRALLARSPDGGVPGPGSELGKPAPTGRRSWSGGGGCPEGQLLIVTLEFPPVFVQNVSPEQVPLAAR